jgi:5'-methylthioadenosine phosphorylase
VASPRAEVGVFGGSGFYEFLTDTVEVEVDTPYGSPAAPVTIGSVAGRAVAFIPRHGRGHRFIPSAVPYRANVWAMQHLGVTSLVGPCSAGSLQSDLHPEEFVVPDQLVDRTWGRADTFYEGPVAHHVSYADPYCADLSAVAVEAARAAGITVHPAGTVVVVQGPRFSTRAESRWYRGQGWEVINMTQYPEAPLARELEICFGNVSLVTDYDVGVEGTPPVTHEEVIRVFEQNNARLRDLLFAAIPALPAERDCECATALANARFEP